VFGIVAEMRKTRVVTEKRVKRGRVCTCMCVRIRGRERERERERERGRDERYGACINAVQRRCAGA